MILAGAGRMGSGLQTPFSRVRSSGLSTIFGVVSIACALFFYTAATARPELFSRVQIAFGVQLGAWAACLIAGAALSPGKTLRISNPVVLTVCLGTLYLVYPSIVWCQGDRIPYNVDIDPAMASQLFILHALFFAGFTLGYVLLAPAVRAEKCIDVQAIAAPWRLFFLALTPLVLTTLVRVATGGGLISNVNYSDQWVGDQANIAAAQASGGIGYVLLQLQSKTWFYPIIAQGTAGGILLARALTSSKHHVWPRLCLICGAAILMILLGDGGRSPTIVYVLVALIVCDTIAGPLPWRIIFPLAAGGLLFFFFAGYYRTYKNIGFSEAIQTIAEDYRHDQGSETAAEFTSMLPKEALTIQLMDESGLDGPVYIVRSVLGLLPSQLMPGKLAWRPTADILSEEMLGPIAQSGAGVAGTSVGDGYRFWGSAGVFMLAVIFGAIFGRMQAWGRRGIGPQNAPVLLRLGLMAGLTGFSYLLIRSSLGELLTFVVYAVVIPWCAISFLLPRNQRWLGPVPLKQGDTLLPVPGGRRPRSGLLPAKHLPVDRTAGYANS
jgi:hypothetical protein